MSRLKKFLTLTLIMKLMMNSSYIYSVTSTADIFMEVLPSMKMEKLSELNFGQIVAGARSKTISLKDGFNTASFKITGVPNTSFSIVLPDEDIVFITGKGDEENQKLHVGNFDSYPKPGSSIQLGSKGGQVIKVGAKVKAAGKNQKPGVYFAIVTINVVY